MQVCVHVRVCMKERERAGESGKERERAGESGRERVCVRVCMYVNFYTISQFIFALACVCVGGWVGVGA